MSNTKKETTGKEMKTSGIIWKELSNSRTEKSFIQLSKSKSKNKKFVPIRSSTVSDLHKNIKALKESKQNTGSNSIKPKDSEEKDASKWMSVGFSPSKSDQSFRNLPKRKETANNAHNQSNSSIMLMNHLNTLDKELKQKTENNPQQTFSLEQQYQSMHQEVQKNRTDFILFKKFVQTQLLKHGEYMKIQFNKIYQIIENCGKQRISEVQLNFQANDQSSHLNNNNQMQSFEISEIHKFDNHSSNDCQQTLDHQSLRIDFDLSLTQKIQHYSHRKNFHKRNESETLVERPRIKSDFQVSSTGVKQKSKKQESFVKSKRQFQKLFHAVGCLKQDIRELKNLSFTLQEKPKAQSFSKIARSSKQASNEVKFGKKGGQEYQGKR